MFRVLEPKCNNKDLWTLSEKDFLTCSIEWLGKRNLRKWVINFKKQKMQVMQLHLLKLYFL
jgi:hypothetical protein